MAPKTRRCLPEGHAPVSALALTICALCLGSGCATTAAEAARGQWYEVRSPRFELWTDGDPELARSMVQDLERYHQVALATTTATEREAAPPLRIFLAKNSASLGALLPSQKLPEGVSLAGIFHPTYRGNYAIVNSVGLAASGGEELTGRVALFHEYAHYILALQGAQVPSWYNEGFAEYMSTTAFREDGSYTVGCAPHYRTMLVGSARWLPTQQILEADNVAALLRGETGFIRTRRAATDGYMQSWYMFHYFASDAARQAKLKEYLRLWVAGTPTEQAVQRAFGSTVGELDILIQHYAQLPSVECLAVKPPRPLAVHAVEAHPLSKSAAHFHVGDLLLSTFGPTDAAISILQTAADARDVGALRGLARAHWLRAERAKDDPTTELQQAQRYLDQAQKIDPNHPEALVLEGHLLRLTAAQLRKRDAAAGTEALARARKSYRKAIHGDDALAEAYYGLGLTYLVEDNGSEEAIAALEVAAFLLPLEAEIAWLVAQLHIHRGNALQAIQPLEYVLRWSQDEQQRAKARTALKDLRELARKPSPPPPAENGAAAGTQ
jgi:tetratricopeptide (TPR) repeat protein